VSPTNTAETTQIKSISGPLILWGEGTSNLSIRPYFSSTEPDRMAQAYNGKKVGPVCPVENEIGSSCPATVVSAHVNY